MHMARKTESIVWTLEDLDRLPDDGNRYELVRGELFVTPAPSPPHELIAVVLSDILGDYVRHHKVGRVFHPRAVVRAEGSEVEPDVMVRAWTGRVATRWEEAPLPLLVVEIASTVTRRRDEGPKRAFYVDLGVPDYWIVDRETRTIRVIRPGTDVVTRDTIKWHRDGAAEPLLLDVAAVFREALGD